MCVKCECAHCCGGRIVTYERPPSLRKPRAPHCSIDFSSSPKLWLCHRRDTHVLSSISDICTLVTTNTHGLLQTTDCGKRNRLRETYFMPLINLRFIFALYGKIWTFMNDKMEQMIYLSIDIRSLSFYHN